MKGFNSFFKWDSWFLILPIVVVLLVGCKEQNPIPNNLLKEKSMEIKGADMSFLPQIRESGLVCYNANNEPEDMLVTLQKSGVNVVRLRLWKDPIEQNSDFESVKKLSNELKNRGFKILLTVHYSDTWADPSQQTKPKKWQGLSVDALKDSIKQYTSKIMTEINPEYIQIGNEINGGFLWPEGNSVNLSQFKSFLAAAIQSVRETNPQTKIVLHYAGFNNASYFFGNMTNIDYDIMGISYYPLWHGKNLFSLEDTLSYLTSVFNKPILIAETAYPFTLKWNDWTNNIIGLDSQLIDQYPASPQGQKNYLQDLKQIISKNSKGLGYIYWGAEWIAYKGPNATNGSTWENLALWDFDRKALPAMETFKD